MITNRSCLTRTADWRIGRERGRESPEEGGRGGREVGEGGGREGGREQKDECSFYIIMYIAYIQNEVVIADHHQAVGVAHLDC